MISAATGQANSSSSSSAYSSSSASSSPFLASCSPCSDARAIRRLHDDDEDDVLHNDDMTTMRTREAGWRWQQLLFLLLLVAVLSASMAHAKISDKRLCYDEDCSVVISEGKTTLPYHSKDYDVLSFPGNVDVKIYSKHAGKRLDLWGVEIRGKRGYAPIKFIRELKIIKNDLKYTVPTELFYSEQVKNDEHSAKESNGTSNDNTPSTVQEDHKKVKIAEDEINKNLQESIAPHQVFPSYDSIYDGTTLPLENHNVEPPPPSYSTQTVQNSAKVDEDVKLDVYPNSNILSSAYNVITGILGSSGGENSEEENVDIASSQQSESEETTEKTPEIQKTDESSLSSEENAGIESDKVTPETNVAEETVEENVESEVNKTANNEIDLVEPVLSTDNEIVNNDKIDSSPSSESNINVVTQSIDSVISPQIKKQQVLDEKGEVLDEKEQVAEILIQNATQKINVADQYANNEEILEPSNTIDAAETKVNINESSSFVDVSSSESFNQGVVEEINSKSEDLQNNTVPKQEDAVTDTDNLISTKNISETASIEVLDKSEFNLKDTSNNFEDVKDSITPEVPLKQEVKEESATKPNESFVSQEQSVQLNLPENKSMPINDHVRFDDNLTAPNNVFIEESKLIDNSEKQQDINDNIVESNSNVVNDGSYSTNLPTYVHNDSTTESTESNFQSAESSHEHIVDIPSTPSFGEFLGNRNLLNAGKGFQYDDSEEIAVDKVVIEESNKVVLETTTSSINEELLAGTEIKQGEENVSFEEIPPASNVEKIVIPPETCDKIYDCSNEHATHQYVADKNAVTNARVMADSSETLLYVCITAVTTLLFSLGYYFIENKRRDAFLIAKINNLEKDLMITRKECIQLDESCKSTKTKLDSIEDESFGSNEMVLSLKTELTVSENARAELEDQIVSLEKELESTSEAGLELERMLREILSSQNEENNPLAQSLEDLQVRLNDQQLANESLKNALAIKTQENETLTGDLTVSLKKLEQLQVEVKKLGDELKAETSTKIHLEQTLSDQVQRLEIQLKTLTEDKSHIRKQLKLKELEVKELLDVVEQLNSNTIDFEKLYEVSQIKAEATHLIEERDELKIKLHEEEGAHQLLEEHVKLVKEEVAFLSEQCRAAEKEKKDAETRLEVLTKFFEEKETQRQKEEALWLEKSGEVMSTVERIQTMQNEILNYKQQIEMLKHEILDQEREYKNQIAALEMKIHEHWVAARQNERRLEEVKAESSQLRNRLTLVEKNINDADPEVKLHPRPLYAGLQAAAGANGESGGAIPPPPLPLFGGADSSSSPLMFAGGPGGGPPYMYPPPPLPPYLPPPPGESRPAPLGGGRLASPPPAGSNNISNNPAGSPPMSPPPPLMPYSSHHHHHHPLHNRHRSPPPLPPFADVPPPPLHHHHHHHLPPPPLPTSMQHDSRGHQPSQQQWEDETLPPLRNSTSGFQQRDQRNARGNHKGSLHSSGESLDKSHHGGKV